MVTCNGDELSENKINILVNCNSIVPYENYECGTALQTPCKSLYDASQVAIKFRNDNHITCQLTIYLLPGVYTKTKQLSFFGYDKIEIMKSNEDNGIVIIDGLQMDGELSSFIYMDDRLNREIGISRITFRNWGINSNLISLDDGYEYTKQILIGFDSCNFDNTSIILNSNSWSKKQFNLSNSNFINLNTNQLDKPILKMINVIFTMSFINVTKCKLNKQVPFIDTLASKLTFNGINFNGNEMGSFLFLKSDSRNVFIANKLQFINNDITLYSDTDGIDDGSNNKYCNTPHKYNGFINLIAPLSSLSNSLNGFKFQNNFINSNSSSSNSIFQIKRMSFDKFSNIDISDITPKQVHFLDAVFLEIKKIDNSTILIEFPIIGNNFVSSIQNTELYKDFDINCSNCEITYRSINTLIPVVTSAPFSYESSSIISKENEHYKPSTIIIITLSIFTTSFLAFVIMFIWKRKFNQQDENKKYISLDLLDAKPPIYTENDEELLDNEGASCDNDDVDQSTPNIHYEQDTNDESYNYDNYYIFNQQQTQQN